MYFTRAVVEMRGPLDRLETSLSAAIITSVRRSLYFLMLFLTACQKDNTNHHNHCHERNYVGPSFHFLPFQIKVYQEQQIRCLL